MIPWWPLLPLGSVAIAIISILAWRDASWREEPVLFAGGALALGAVMLAGLAIARTRPLPRPAIAWILAVGVALNLLGTGLWHSDDVNRYAVEGAQILAGQNPYAIPPGDPRATALVEPTIAARVNHPHMTAIYPPVALGFEALVMAVHPGLPGFTALACVGSLALIVLALALLRATGAAPGLVVAVAWNPVLPIFASGEAHNDIVMAALLVGGVLLAVRGHGRSAVLLVILAALVKPFAAIALPAIFWRVGWHRVGIVAIVAMLAYLPFLGAGSGLVASLLTFGGSLHYHGALDPWLRLALRPLLPAEALEPAIRGVLLVALLCGLAWVWRRRAALPLPTLVLHLAAMLLVCLPTLHPWYLCLIVGLLGAARGWTLPVWTACAGIYWFHGVGMLRVGEWVEDPVVTALAHLPAAVVLAVETWRRRHV
jgi:hypothetical protein